VYIIVAVYLSIKSYTLSVSLSKLHSQLTCFRKFSRSSL